MSKDAYGKEIAGQTAAGEPKILLVDSDGKVLISLASDTVAAAIKAKTDLIPAAPADQAKMAQSLDFWSEMQEEVQLADVSAPGSDVALPSVVVSGLPLGVTLLRAVAMLKFRAVENTNVAANKLSGAQYVQVRVSTPGDWANAITLADDQFGIAASTREGGDVVIGDIDVKATVTGNGTYNMQWAAALVDAANMQFNDVQVGLRLYWR